MPSNLKYSTTLRNARLNAIATEAGNGAILRIYSGTQPTSVAAPISGTLLAELTCGSPFAGPASNGVLTANAITQDSSANATGTATHFRLFKSDGTTPVLDGSVGTSDADLILDSVSIRAGGTVSVTSLTITAGNA